MIYCQEGARVVRNDTDEEDIGIPSCDGNCLLCEAMLLE